MVCVLKCEKLKLYTIKVVKSTDQKAPVAAISAHERNSLSGGVVVVTSSFSDSTGGPGVVVMVTSSFSDSIIFADSIVLLW